MKTGHQDVKTEPASKAIVGNSIVGAFSGTGHLHNDRQKRLNHGCTRMHTDSNLAGPMVGTLRCDGPCGRPMVGTSRCDVRRPERAAGRRDMRWLVGKMKAARSADVPGFRRLTLRSATGTAQRAIPTVGTRITRMNTNSKMVGRCCRTANAGEAHDHSPAFQGWVRHQPKIKVPHGTAGKYGDHVQLMAVCQHLSSLPGLWRFAGNESQP
jgi:hypothetical protein